MSMFLKNIGLKVLIIVWLGIPSSNILHKMLFFIRNEIKSIIKYRCVKHLRKTSVLFSIFLFQISSKIYSCQEEIIRIVEPFKAAVVG